LDEYMSKNYGLEVYFKYPQMEITKGGGLLSVGVTYEVEVRKWNKNKSEYNVIYNSKPLCVISGDDLMGDKNVESCCNYFLEFFINLAERAPEIAFLNKSKKRSIG
ncbi:hypothetical protein ACQJ7Q_07780, partial [Helicobacter pylori]